MQPRSKEKKKKTWALWEEGSHLAIEGLCASFFFPEFSHEETGWKSRSDVGPAGGPAALDECRWF